MAYSALGKTAVVFKYFAAFLFTITAFLAFSLLSVILIPDKNVQKNIEKTIKYTKNYIDYPDPLIEGIQHRLDYAMDGQITNIIYSINSKEPLQSALLGRSRMDQGYVSQWKYVEYNIKNKNQPTNNHYARYWHGNSFLFRYFYSFLHFNEIKLYIFIITSILLTVFIMFTYKMVGSRKTLAILTGLFFVNFYIMQFSMQMSPVLIITLIIGMMILKKGKSDAKPPYMILFITGMIVNYFDLLTAPVLTLGIPLLLWISMQLNEAFSLGIFIAKATQLFKLGLLWLTGYTGAWIAKILIAYPFCSFNLVDDFIAQFTLRAGAQEFSRFDAIEKNLNLIQLPAINLILLVLIILAIVRFNRKGLLNSLLFILVALTPFLWIAATANHTYHHNWFTYRILAVSVSGIMLAIISLIDWERLINFSLKNRRIKAD